MTATTPNTPPPNESLQTASDLLSDLQVETYSSMERREKTEFILEQMRLLIAVARSKDAEQDKKGKESLGGGEAEWVKVRVGGRKVNEEFLKEKENEVRLRAGDFADNQTDQCCRTGLETQILRIDDSTRVAKYRIPRCRQVLLQSLGNTLNQGG